MEFRHLGFAPTYEVEVDPEFPGDGDWRCPVYGFDRDGRLVDPFTSRWGSPAVVRVMPDGVGPWVGMFPAGGLGCESAAFACPAPRHLGVMAEGQVYVIDVTDPARDSAVMPVTDVHQVEAIAEVDVLVLVRSLDIVAFGTDGPRWRTPRLGLDSLRVVEATANEIVCTVDNRALGGSEVEQITLEPTTGEQRTGPRFAETWPEFR
jgi:hypothetical protein